MVEISDFQRAKLWRLPTQGGELAARAAFAFTHQGANAAKPKERESPCSAGLTLAQSLSGIQQADSEASKSDISCASSA